VGRLADIRGRNKQRTICEACRMACLFICW